MSVTLKSKPFFLPLSSLPCPLCIFIFRSSQNAICQPHITPVIYHRSYLTPQPSVKPPYEYQSHQHVLNDWLCPIHLNPLSISVSVYLTRRASFGGVCACFLLHLNRMWVFFLSPATFASTLLLYSHFPIITEAYKLPQGTILDLLMFPAFSRCFPSKSLSHRLWHLCLCGTI